jgi:hypothetical protein
MKTMNRNSQETKYGEHPTSTLHVSRETDQNKNVNKNKTRKMYLSKWLIIALKL